MCRRTWLVGVAFGVYYHGPGRIDADVIPVDLSTLRVSDAKIRDLLEAAEKAKEELILDGNVSGAATRFTDLIEGFLDHLNSSKTVSLLKDFDQVVLAVLCPENENQKVESVLLQAEKLEEEVGPDAVCDFLREFVSSHPLIRERYIDALATLKNWAEVAQLIRQIAPEQLSRLELEHAISACAEMACSKCSETLLNQHTSRYDDKSAKLFRQEVSRRYPKAEYDDPGSKT